MPKRRPKRKPFAYLHLPPDFNPRFATLHEACSYCRHSLWMAHEKINAGRWKVFKDGARTIVIFASVIEDEARLMAAGNKRKPGRPKAEPEQTISASAG